MSTDDPRVPDGVWEALQRMIEDGLLRGAASRDDALAVAHYRDRVRFLATPPTPEQAGPSGEAPQAQSGEVLLQEVDYAIRHGWPLESTQRLTRIRAADKERVGLLRAPKGASK